MGAQLEAVRARYTGGVFYDEICLRMYGYTGGVFSFKGLGLRLNDVAVLET